MPEKSPLHCLVCGYERGGTTLVGELIRQHPRMDGRFEVGFLLAEPLSAFPDMHPYARSVKIAWGLDDDALGYVCAAPSYAEAYRRLLERSNLPDKSVRIYDKTPRYMKHLPEVMQKVDVPVVCVVRDPRGVYWSAQKHWDKSKLELERWEPLYRRFTAPDMPAFVRRITQRIFERRSDLIKMDAFCEYYRTYGRACRQASARFGERLLLVQYDALCAHPVEETRRIYEFLGLEFDESYLNFPKRPDQYVDRGGIRTELALEYRAHMRRGDQKRVLRNTQEFSEWHWLVK
ncbi:MAG: hypothetical protein Fur0018_07260 [Anaerolineales bacterium]